MDEPVGKSVAPAVGLVNANAPGAAVTRDDERETTVARVMPARLPARHTMRTPSTLGRPDATSRPSLTVDVTVRQFVDPFADV